MAKKGAEQPRSGCPVSMSLEIFGDRWSLLVIRDLMVRGMQTFKEFQNSGEGIATNVLTDRLQRLEALNVIESRPANSDGRRVNYRLTQRGIDLAPLLFDILVWGARHEKTSAPAELINGLENNREQFIEETRRRWREQDLTPLLPKFPDKITKGTKKRRAK